MKRNVLIVEDDKIVQVLLALHLENEGFKVSCAATGEEMFSILGKEAINFILLDLNLPDEDGLVLARQVRARSTVPIIVLTARKAHEDCFTALKIGVDDYLTKPFEPRELALRMHNILGRSEAHGSVHGSDILKFNGWILDITGHTLTAPQGEEVSLSPGEFNILVAFAKAPNRVLYRDHLLDAISVHNATSSRRAIDVAISRLRKKIEKNPANPKLIITIAGHGYKFAGTLE